MRLLYVIFLLPACQLQAPLERPAWSHAQAGTVGLIGRAAVWNDHAATSLITFESNFGDQEVELETDLDGELGLAFGVEAYIAEDWSLLLGYDQRRFEPGDTPGFLFETVTAEEIFLATRWLTPWSFGTEQRWRPYLEVKVGYLPSMEFDAAIDLSEIDQPNPAYEFDGSPSWNLGLSAGLLYQLRSDLLFQFSVLHEVPLDASQDRVHLDFLPGFPIDLDTEVEPEGTMILFGITWYL